jgi:hypothetical protein
MLAAGMYQMWLLAHSLLTTQRTYLLHSEVPDRINYTTIAATFDDIKLLWEGGVKRDNILLFVTNAAPYMVKAATVFRY